MNIKCFIRPVLCVLYLRCVVCSLAVLTDYSIHTDICAAHTLTAVIFILYNCLLSLISFLFKIHFTLQETGIDRGQIW